MARLWVSASCSIACALARNRLALEICCLDVGRAAREQNAGIVKKGTSQRLCANCRICVNRALGYNEQSLVRACTCIRNSAIST